MGERGDRVFVLGSGFSVAAAPKSRMPTVRGLQDDLVRFVRDRGREDLLTQDDAPTVGDLEGFLGFLATRQPFLREHENLENRALFLRVSEWLAEHIFNCEQHALASPPPEWLEGLVRLWHGEGSAVITLNYDTLVESSALEWLFKNEREVASVYAVELPVAEARRSAVLGGGEGPKTLRLVKLHGSLNWYYSGAEPFYGETIYDLQGHVGWQRPQPVKLAERRSKLPSAVPLVIPPTPSKSSYFENETVRELWRVARAALMEAQEMWLMGYSLPLGDQQMAALLATTCARKRIVPVNTDGKIVERVREVIPGANVDERFVGGCDPMERAVSALCAHAG